MRQAIEVRLRSRRRLTRTHLAQLREAEGRSQRRFVILGEQSVNNLSRTRGNSRFQLGLNQRTTNESSYLREPVNRRVAGSSPARGANSLREMATRAVLGINRELASLVPDSASPARGANIYNNVERARDQDARECGDFCGDDLSKSPHGNWFVARICSKPDDFNGSRRRTG